MKFRIIYEDSQVLVVDKPAGLVVNRALTNRQETLQDQLSEYFNLGRDLGIGGRAGIVHRLDRETSGVLVVAKTPEAFVNLQRQFKERRARKEYVALVHGKVSPNKGSIVGTLGRIGKFGKFGIVVGGREARTDFELKKYLQFKRGFFEQFLEQGKFGKSRVNYLKRQAQEYTLLNLYPLTGRTHQVRVHLKSISHPVVSDLLYTPGKLLKFDKVWCRRLFLHALSLEFNHPTSQRRLKLISDLPKDLKDAIVYLEEV